MTKSVIGLAGDAIARERGTVVRANAAAIDNTGGLLVAVYFFGALSVTKSAAVQQTIHRHSSVRRRRSIS